MAARLAVATAVAFIRDSVGAPHDRTWPFPFDPALSTAANRLAIAFRLANRRVFDDGTKDPALSGMGTTLVAAFIDRTQIVIGHVGDSRAYRRRNGTLEQITRDDTWINAVLGVGAAGSDHPMRHVLTSGIGMRTDLTPSVAQHDLKSGDEWLLCTDGVHGYVTDDVIADAMRGAASADAAVTAILQAAVAHETMDNATALVIRAGAA